MQSIRTNNCHCFQSLSYQVAIYNNKNNDNNYQLQTLIFKPLSISKPTMPIESLQVADVYENQDDSKPITTKRALQIGALSLFVLPAKGLFVTNFTENTKKSETVVASKELVVATIDDDSTVFHEGEFVHGFGYDTAKRYAQHLGVSLRLKTYDNEQSALAALKNGDVDMALGIGHHADGVFSTNLIACDSTTQLKLEKHGLNPNVGFTFLAGDSGLIDHSASFLCSQETLAQNQAVARFYDQNLLKNDYSQKHFQKALSQKLPIYEHAFKTGADKHNHDWQLLAVVSYQESHLNPDAISPTGVQGLMMLTNETAKEMGVTDRTDAIQSIQGGAKYLEVVDKLFADVPKSERLWFVLAAYNMGPNAVKRIQNELVAQGKDGNSWAEVYTYLSANAQENSRYIQCMHYVTNIRTYLEAIKTMQA